MPAASTPPTVEVWSSIAAKMRGRPYEDDVWNDYADQKLAPYLEYLAEHAPLHLVAGEFLGAAICDILITTDGTKESLLPLLSLVASIEADMGIKVPGNSPLARKLARPVTLILKYPPPVPPESAAKLMGLRLVEGDEATEDEGPPVWRGKDPEPPAQDQDELDRHQQVG
jgi:hypothetical protein